MEEYRKVRLFWTGGWDSTFRLLCLAQNEKLQVEPHYIIDRERGSYKREMEAMDQMRAMIYRRIPGSQKRLLPTVYFEKDKIKPCPEIREKYQTLSSRFTIGSQYEWLAEYVAMHGYQGIEMCIMHVVNMEDNISRLISACVEVVDPVVGAYYGFPPDMDPKLPESIFYSYHFPVYTLEKKDMGEIAKERGFYDILISSWFCFQPIQGKPCGVCNPCNVAITEGMTYRFPPEALKRNRYRWFYRSFYKARHALRRIGKGPADESGGTA